MWIKNYPAPRRDPWHRGYDTPEPIWHRITSTTAKGCARTACGRVFATVLIGDSDLRELSDKTRANRCKSCIPKVKAKPKAESRG